MLIFIVELATAISAFVYEAKVCMLSIFAQCQSVTVIDWAGRGAQPFPTLNQAPVLVAT